MLVCRKTVHSLPIPQSTQLQRPVLSCKCNDLNIASSFQAHTDFQTRTLPPNPLDEVLADLFAGETAETKPPTVRLGWHEGDSPIFVGRKSGQSPKQRGNRILLAELGIHESLGLRVGANAPTSHAGRTAPATYVNWRIL